MQNISTYYQRLGVYTIKILILQYIFLLVFPGYIVIVKIQTLYVLKKSAIK